MSVANARYSLGSEFEPFLTAGVGEDGRGYVVTMLSAFARLGLDPWKEASDLSALNREAAGARLGLVLARFRDVPALALDHGVVARKLVRLLPPRSGLGAGAKVGEARDPSKPSIEFWVILAVIVFLAQLLVSGTPQPVG